jgi:hypothetical protein
MQSVDFVELNFRPNVELVSIVRRFVSDFYSKLLKDEDTISRVALATHELLENAVKYSCDRESRIRVDFEPDGMVIRTWNHAKEEMLASLESAFASMHAEPDAFTHYKNLMIRNAKRTDGSGLGLARIRAEAEMSLSLEVEDGVACIKAVTHLNTGERP